MVLYTLDSFNIAKFIGAFLYGVYSGVFALYLHYAAEKAKKGTNNAILYYALCVLYILSGVVTILDILIAVFQNLMPSLDPNFVLQYRTTLLQPILFGCCDFIGQSILIYRCWIMWSCNTRVVIVPKILALAYLVLWMGSLAGNFITSGGVDSTAWSYVFTTAGLAMSMTLNALVTSLIAFRIFTAVKGNTTFYENFRSLGVAGGRQLEFRYIMFVIIESGMVLFSIQLARVVSTVMRTGNTTSELDASNIIISCHEMFNGIIPTIILVRVSMGLSFDDEASLKEAVDSFRFAANDPYSIPELRSIDKENDSSCDNEDIQMSERQSTLDTIDKFIDLKDSYIHEEGDLVESV